MSRGLSGNFLSAMRQGLERGRKNGYCFWDSSPGAFIQWIYGPTGIKSDLMCKLRGELAELTVAVEKENQKDILREAADVANLAMMVAKAEGAID